jgi:hypothetical protein
MSFLLPAAILTSECECTTDGFSGGVFTSTIGCRRSSAFFATGATQEAFCFVKGGAASQCPCSVPSQYFPGAAYRICTSCMRHSSVLILIIVLAVSDIEVGGLDGDAEEANGIYSLRYEIPYSYGSLPDCGYNAIYVQPTEQFNYVLFSDRGTAAAAVGSTVNIAILRVNPQAELLQVARQTLAETDFFRTTSSKPNSEVVIQILNSLLFKQSAFIAIVARNGYEWDLPEIAQTQNFRDGIFTPTYGITMKSGLFPALLMAASCLIVCSLSSHLKSHSRSS